MSVRPTRIDGMLVIEPETATDDRGTFRELFRMADLREYGWEGTFERTALSRSLRRGTLRGLHYQDAPRRDARLVTCIDGAAYDVAVDVRRGSPTFGVWEAVELSAADGRAVFLPEGLAHGFETLQDETTLLYHVSAYFEQTASRGIRWDDPTLGIPWPLPPSSISEQDRRWGPLAR